jgi:hypothetical protein
MGSWAHERAVLALRMPHEPTLALPIGRARECHEHTRFHYMTHIIILRSCSLELPRHRSFSCDRYTSKCRLDFTLIITRSDKPKPYLPLPLLRSRTISNFNPKLESRNPKL